mmetsp:Transcript_11372/g.22311  ORF Transcript_11372/g.22311 Transcript_11372/m.22311 type:complete len:87 (-) Transcript_11372:1307-1567(-)
MNRRCLTLGAPLSTEPRWRWSRDSSVDLRSPCGGVNTWQPRMKSPLDLMGFTLDVKSAFYNNVVRLEDVHLCGIAVDPRIWDPALP